MQPTYVIIVGIFFLFPESSDEYFGNHLRSKHDGAEDVQRNSDMAQNRIFLHWKEQQKSIKRATAIWLKTGYSCINKSAVKEQQWYGSKQDIPGVHKERESKFGSQLELSFCIKCVNAGYCFSSFLFLFLFFLQNFMNLPEMFLVCSYWRRWGKWDSIAWKWNENQIMFERDPKLKFLKTPLVKRQMVGYIIF